ncbi:hypothetical protein STRMA_0923 [Streptococcus macacae NCTC 11558]|uniref:Uncharacterized protein n=2 Tax=Streptococcus macacae TaxID=1339 RepID=G5JVR7_9STRE|nr:hypothetical protein STRMA_0923 [Streptococcus macacae NCTC 11558]
MFGSKKETLTKEQQDNVVKRIARNYKVKKVEFLNLEKNNSTGYYNLVFKVNDKNSNNIVQFQKIEELNTAKGIIALDPIEEFSDIRKYGEFNNSESVDISEITVIYLKE